MTAKDLNDQAVFAAVIQAGREVIDDAKQHGRDVAEWEAFWMHLLREYNQLIEESEHTA